MNQTWFEKGIEKGFETGVAAGQRDLLRQLLEARFGNLSRSHLDRLSHFTLTDVSNLGKACRHADSLRQLGFDE